MRLLIGFVTTVCVSLAVVGFASAQPKPEFRLGCKALAERSPDVVREPLGNEHFDPMGPSPGSMAFLHRNWRWRWLALVVALVATLAPAAALSRQVPMPAPVAPAANGTETIPQAGTAGPPLAIAEFATPEETATPAASATPGASEVGAVSTAMIGDTVTATPTATAQTDPEGVWFSLGESVMGRPIEVVRLGGGDVRLAFVGAFLGGWERNTERLVRALHEQFRDHPEEIPPGLSVYFAPGLNPDGLASGSGPEAAWNAPGVDLNRNFDTPNWESDSHGRPGGRYGPTGVRTGAGGTAPFSEPEARAIRDFILSRRIDAVLSYHSGIISVTARDGGGGTGEPLAKLVASITGYPYVAVWTEYAITGQFMDWLDAIEVKGVEIDLPDQQGIGWEKNLASVRAVMKELSDGEGP